MSPPARPGLARVAAASVAAVLIALGIGWGTPADAPAAVLAGRSAGLQPSTPDRAAVPASASASAPATAPKRADGATAGSQSTTTPKRVFVVGDSLTVGTTPWLASAFSQRGWTLTGEDARVGRGVPEGLSILRQRGSRLPGTVVVALGTNNLSASTTEVASWLRTTRSIVGHRRLVWVNLCLNDSVHSYLGAYRRINTDLRTFAPRYNVQVANWCRYATRHDIANGPDGIHYTSSAYRRRAYFYAWAVAVL